MKKIIKKIFSEKNFPFSISIITIIITTTLYYYKKINFNIDNYKDFINICVNISSLILGLLTASLAIIMQIDGENENLKFLKENNLLDLFYSYFKFSIISSLIVIIFSIIAIIFFDFNIILNFILIFLIVLTLLSTYRCINLLFNILKNNKK